MKKENIRHTNLFKQRLKATYSLAEEFNSVRPEVANACHEWNKLYM